MGKILASKKFWLLVFIILIAIGIFVYRLFFYQETEISPLPEEINEQIPEEIAPFKFLPVTAIMSPEEKSWWNRDFEVEIVDMALEADLAIDKRGCQYLIEDLGTGKVGGGFRKCGQVTVNIPVGEGKTCSSSYSKEEPSWGKCMVSTLAFDIDGNQSGWRSRIFNIDLIPPIIQEVDIPSVLNPGQEYIFQAAISDNSRIVGCWFYIDEKLIDAPVRINPIPCGDDDQCTASLNYTFERMGEYSLNFSCSDVAGNSSFGNPVLIKVIANRPPEISFCRVLPSRGTVQAAFQFETEASDPDGDELFYFWDFGDGNSSVEQNPIHFYLSPDIYEPRVTVSDGVEQVKCSTAWAVVAEE